MVLDGSTDKIIFNLEVGIISVAAAFFRIAASIGYIKQGYGYNIMAAVMPGDGQSGRGHDQQDRKDDIADFI